MIPVANLPICSTNRTIHAAGFMDAKLHTKLIRATLRVRREYPGRRNANRKKLLQETWHLLKI